MKALFTAVGSIGSRHINNFTKVCSNNGIELEIDVVRYSDRLLPEEIKHMITREVRLEDVLEDNYDVVFITDETSTHFSNIYRFKDNCLNMFIEKPIFDTCDYNIEEIYPCNKDAVFYVACPIRFTDYYRVIKDVVKRNEVYSARIIFSSYMPNWQKGRDYRNSFRCFRQRGGGVDIDSLHEIDYMTDLFGMPKSLCSYAKKCSNLEMDAPDIADYIFEYDNLLVEMHLDYFGRTNNRRIELYAKDDVIVVDFNKKNVTWQCSNTSKSFAPDDDFYIKEMTYFFDLINSKGTIVNINPIEKAYDNLCLAKGIIPRKIYK